ncbi:MMPL family transporter [Cohnella sp. AR92]|uniref:MMPL family transporter n=1 Tax=Cohnella sp. AR92 TaxID=648716 RepID=UPI001EDFC330|nr:MMPL family transporter [Cohnella sp. AR92]
MTVVVGFSTLIFVNFPALRDFGVTTVIDTLLSLICALTILPALIVLFRKRERAKIQTKTPSASMDVEKALQRSDRNG